MADEAISCNFLPESKPNCAKIDAAGSRAARIFGNRGRAGTAKVPSMKL
jgi:hypothetical protein